MALCPLLSFCVAAWEGVRTEERAGVGWKMTEEERVCVGGSRADRRFCRRVREQLPCVQLLAVHAVPTRS